MSNARKIAVSTLTRIEQDGGYSNIVLDRTLRENDLSAVDRSFLTALVYGVLDRRLTLDYLLNQYIKQGIRKVQPFTKNALRCALYQLLYMERVPESAAVNETVKLVKSSKERYNAAFVNAVLRSYLRKPAALPQDDSKTSVSVRYSCPEWIVDSLIADYGVENAVGFLENSLIAPPVFLRVNTLRITAEELIKRLADEKITAVPTSDKFALQVQGGIDIKNCTCYHEGLFFVEDLACQRSVAALSPQSGERVLDLCAAPGGKSFAAAMLMQNKGEILSFDLYEKRANLIAAGANRLGFSCITASAGDATAFDEDLKTFDRVICDVPCSGLGVLRRKPEIKYKEPESLS
ncbi:MAG: 16S rRNA (cytosine(967)-C(5))-methyltransferase RsmB, partial [Clostridia bacterium]|nr:16S rRNA (cytosine(967)-C(5))-methyltransferase RsmB [Clostridia bacterium]